MGILQSKAYYTGDRATYHPSVTSCWCKDWEFANSRKRGYKGACKHMIAEYFIALIVRRRIDHTLPISITAPRKVYSY